MVRDLNALGYKGGDALIELGEFVSVVLASPPGSAVRYAVEGGWSQTDHLIANWAEQQAGLTDLPHRYARPGIDQAPQADPGPIDAVTGSPRWSAQTVDEFTARRNRDRARGEELAASEQALVRGSRKAKEGVKDSA